MFKRAPEEFANTTRETLKTPAFYNGGATRYSSAGVSTRTLFVWSADICTRFSSIQFNLFQYNTAQVRMITVEPKPEGIVSLPADNYFPSLREVSPSENLATKENNSLRGG